MIITRFARDFCTDSLLVINTLQVIIPYFQQSSSKEDSPVNDAMRKKLEKTEKRAERRRQKRF